ncbi:hypothetical protein Angca_004841, partial [Angiostrongylus cantonensis]
MSTKHLRRMLQEREQQEELKECLEEEEPIPRRTGPLNRFAALQDDGGNDETAKKSEDDDGQNSERSDEGRRLHSKAKDKRKTNKKKKHRQEEKEEDLDDEQLLEKFLAENRSTTSQIEENEHLGVAELLKPDPRLFDPAVELKRALGKTFKESSGSRSHHASHGAGRIVKQKNTWPPVRNLGLSMELDREEGEVKWFKFVHNSQYEELERWLCWAVEDEKVFDPGLIKEILVGNPYHLNSLMLLANIFHMQEDVTESCDVIVIIVCNSFQLFSNCSQLCQADIENGSAKVKKWLRKNKLPSGKGNKDPLAVLLLIDTIAIKAKQYSWFKDFYQCWKEWKNLNVLPNFCYSAALAQFLDAKTDEDFDVADQMLTQAICAFPGVISMLLDKLQIEPDPLVESHRHLGTFARNKESDGVKLVFKIYVNEAAELWKTPETLSWLEHVTRSCAERQHCTNEMKIWREK